MRTYHKKIFEAFKSEVEDQVDHHVRLDDEVKDIRLWQTFFKFLRVVLPYWDKMLLVVLLVTCASITGMLWLQGHLKDATFCKWVQSRDLWWRRTAVVSTTPLNQRTKGGTGDFERTLAMVGRVQHERHPMIWKAVSWALRNLVQWDKDRVEAYVANHDDVLPAPVIREVRKKIETGVKTPRS